jgi:predicted oxidoreductase (fatty acid repression mutant protein)
MYFISSFPFWVFLHSSSFTHIAMLIEPLVWTGLEALGFGANLQHYNPLIDAGVAKQWDLPSDWRLVAQMVFGSPEAGPGEKTQKPVEERVKVFGKL